MLFVTLPGPSSYLIYLPQLEACWEMDTPGLWAIPSVTLLCHTTGQEGSEVGTEIIINLFCIYSFFTRERRNIKEITAIIRKLKSS